MELNEELFEVYRSRETDEVPAQDLLNEAKEKSDTAVIVLTRGTGESSDNRPIKGDYYLTNEEKRLLETISGTFPKTVVILNVGYPIEMGWVEEYGIDAVLWCGLPGMAGGRALAEVLEGTVCHPSGRLPDSSLMKHFIANNAENHRNHSHSIMSERCMRELYLKIFEVAMEVNMPDAMMTGYNPANGEWCAGDEELLEGILREEWGFTGYVMTDWGSSTCCPPAPTAQGGNSWVAPGCMDDSEPNMIVAALEDGTIDRERVSVPTCGICTVPWQGVCAGKGRKGVNEDNLDICSCREFFSKPSFIFT